MRRAVPCLPSLTVVCLVLLAGCPGPREQKSDRPRATSEKTKEAASGAGKKPVDPIVANGKIFENWPRPKLALVFTGEQNGYIEPCGCQGRENQLGGLARRHSFFRKLEADHWPMVAVDVGGLTDRFGRQAEIKYQITADAMTTMGYDAIGFGPKDLRLPAEALLAVTSGETCPFVSANVNLFDLTQPFRVVEAGGKKVGITSILGEKYQAEINNDQLTLSSAQTALENVLPKLRAAQCDLLILLAHATPEESQELARRFPDFDIVVTAGGAEEPPHELTKVEGQKTLFVEVGHKGKYAIVLGQYDDPQEPWRYPARPSRRAFRRLARDATADGRVSGAARRAWASRDWDCDRRRTPAPRRRGTPPANSSAPPNAANVIRRPLAFGAKPSTPMPRNRWRPRRRHDWPIRSVSAAMPQAGAHRSFSRSRAALSA